MNNPETTNVVRREFAATFGTEPQFLARAPGRVNVIGEHVDYNGGFVLPAALQQRTVLAVRGEKEAKVRLSATSFPEIIEFSFDELTPGASSGWDRYVRGVLARLRERGVPLSGFSAHVCSDVPMGGGLSSSAALEAATAMAVLHLAAFPMDRLEIARACQEAEHLFAGVPCGIMDQAASLLGREGHLLLLNCRDNSTRHVPFHAEGWELLIANSGVAHSLADGEYRKRREGCESAAQALRVSLLSDVEENNLETALAHPDLAPEHKPFVRHVLTENARTLAFTEALEAGRIAQAGRLMVASHQSLRDDYRVSCEELDWLVEQLTAIEGVAGARMTGGGFGGSAIALVKTTSLPSILEDLPARYFSAFQKTPALFVTRPGPGADVLEL
jgi:galactokinase